MVGSNEMCRTCELMNMSSNMASQEDESYNTCGYCYHSLSRSNVGMIGDNMGIIKNMVI